MLSFFYKFEWILFFSVIFLLILSLAVLYPISRGEIGKNDDESHFMKQAIFSIIGVAVFFIFSWIDYRSLKNYSTVLFLAGLIFLFLVLLFGKIIRGTTGWLGFFGLHLQPIEPFKIVAVIYLAKFFSLKSRDAGNLKNILISFLPIALSIFLILRQPDLGSALVIIFIWIIILFISGLKKKHLFLIILFGLIISLSSWLFFLKDYQKERITTLFKPYSDPLGAGYNVIQSTVAVGSGGLWGKGLGHGSQSQLNFLPEKHTDFIFAVIAEELGFGGAIFVFILMVFAIFRSVRIAIKSRDNFGKLLGGGIAAIFFIQSVINIGMNIGLVPVAGIPLPFLSYGGSSLITMFAGAGILESIYRVSRT